MNPIEWTFERIEAESAEKIKIIRENARRLGNHEVASLCDQVLTTRANAKRVNVGVRPSGQVVIGFHFVCPGEKGLTRDGDGTVWTGTWVVDVRHAEIGSKIGSYVALHRAKSQVSYLQGTIKDWRKAAREKEYAAGQKAKIETGVDFLLELTPEPYEWNGEGTGEKGYVWGNPTR